MIASRKPSIASGLLIVILAGFVSVATAGEGFTRGDIAGKWAFSARGTIVPPAAPEPTPIVLLGIAIFEEDGTCSLSDTLNIGGTRVDVASLTCSFTVEPDGSGTIVEDFGGPAPVNLSIVIVDENEILVIRTDSAVVSGSFKRQAVPHDDEDDDD